MQPPKWSVTLWLRDVLHTAAVQSRVGRLTVCRTGPSASTSIVDEVRTSRGTRSWGRRSASVGNLLGRFLAVSPYFLRKLSFAESFLRMKNPLTLYGLSGRPDSNPRHPAWEPRSLLAPRATHCRRERHHRLAEHHRAGRDSRKPRPANAIIAQRIGSTLREPSP